MDTTTARVDARRRLRRLGPAMMTDTEERHGAALARVRRLPASAGTRTVRENLVDALTELSVMRDVISGQLRLRDDLAALDENDVAALAGDLRPSQGPAHWLGDYLRAEQRLGRLRADLNCDMTALCLLATLLGLALMPGPPPPDDLIVAVLDEHVRVLVEGAARR